MLDDIIVTLKPTEREKALRYTKGSAITITGVLDNWASFAPISLVDGEIVQ
jgi:hypothetical protein